MLAAARTSAVPAPSARSAALSLPADPEQAVAESSDMARVDLLVRLGLEEAAMVEMDDLAQRSMADPVTLYGLSAAYERRDRYDLALRIVRRHFSDAVTSGDPALPRAFWEIAYPLAWSRELADAATRAGVDRLLLAAVAREESNFSPRARSRAGARGLMQVLPQTARTLGGRLAVPNGDVLDEPGPNVAIGAAILADLIREFSDPRLAVAAYNAGPARLRQWWEARRSDDIEAFVEQIPYEETRVYVKRVMVAWTQYRRLYGNGTGNGL
jgi:soluble lytic murein transglycosylase